MTSLYAAIAPHFTQDLLTPELKVGVHDEGGSWPFVAASLAQRLPLRGIEWRNLVGATKSIDKLPITFVAQNELHDALPLVCIYLVKCEDLEHYRSSAKARLAAWVEQMNAAKVEWMVLYVPLGTRTRAGSSSRNSASTTHAVYKKIFDKIRSDFAHRRSSSGSTANNLNSGSSTGTGGNSSSSSSNAASGLGATAERICKIEILEGNSIVGGGAPGQHQQHEAQWSELVLRLRRCVMDAFEIKCFQYEEAVRVLDAKRTSSAFDWDFGAFFLAKERLALMYQQTHLLDDAIRHFDELDAIFMNLRASETPPFAPDGAATYSLGAATYSLGADDAIFTVAPLALGLDTTQHAIAMNCASARVIQLHCFCRQLRALFLMGSYASLIERATAFIATFTESLVQLSANNTESFARHLPYQWAVGACLEVAYACELASNSHDYADATATVPAIAPEVMARHLGDILYLARRLLTRFAKTSTGVDVGTAMQLSVSSALSLSIDASAQIDDDDDPLDVVTTGDAGAANPRAWYEWLARMFAAPQIGERLERCVWELSHLASLQYSRAGRHRFAVFLGAECARYHMRHCEFESASRLLRSHARQCEEDKWWRLVGACVRSICSAELALGRAAEAVTACFSLLAITQDARAELGCEDLDTMMRALVQSLKDGNNDSDGSNTNNAAAARLRMRELLTPTMRVETMQTAGGSDLDDGQVRVALSIVNGFPAGVHIEKLRIRFLRLQQQQQQQQQHVDDDDHRLDDSTAATTSLQVELPATATDSIAELPRLHSLVLDDASTSLHDHAGESSSNSSVSAPANVVTHKQGDARSSGSTGQQLSDVPLDSGSSGINRSSPAAPDPVDADIDIDAFVLEEHNVYLHEHASVDLTFLHSGLAVGTYVCRSIDCVIAGNTFRLFADATPSAATHDVSRIQCTIPRRESTLHVAVHGPPVLAPQSIEQLCVVINAQRDTVANGVLELTVGSTTNSDDSDILDEPLLQIVRAELQTTASVATSSKPNNIVQPSSRDSSDERHTASSERSSSDRRDKLLLRIPSLAPCETLVYRVWISVGDADAVVTTDVPVATVTATLRYEHVVATESVVAMRRTDAAFQVLRPLNERVRLQRVGAQIVVAVALTCNAACRLVLRDYRLALRDGDSSDDRVVIAHDPNATVRNTSLRPGETVHLAFMLLDRSPSGGAVGSSSSTADAAHLMLDVAYDAVVFDATDESNSVSDSEQLTTALLPDMQWASSVRVHIPLATVCGAHFRIDVEPRVAGRDAMQQQWSTASTALELAVGDEVAFCVTVRATRSSSSSAQQAGAAPPSMLLCLDARSERDWILMGKQRERFVLTARIATDDLGARATGDCAASPLAFSTHKRFIATRTGRLRFPSFHLRSSTSRIEATGDREEEEVRVASECVLFPQRAMHVLVRS